jgi:hypothetical protein
MPQSSDLTGRVHLLEQNQAAILDIFKKVCMGLVLMLYVNNRYLQKAYMGAICDRWIVYLAIQIAEVNTNYHEIV